jgi:4-hydroxyphenylacetate 3-monooxygenase
VDNPVNAPGFAKGVKGLASLYDYQWKHKDTMLRTSDETGALVAHSYDIPRTHSDLKALGNAMYCAADHSKGMMGREPSYMNRVISTLAGGADFLSANDTQFSDNIRKYHSYVRENDLSSTHTIINPRPSRTEGPATQANARLGAHVTKERDDGIIINGARYLATMPVADELAVMPSRYLNTEDARDYAFFFSIPTATPGLSFQCRETLDANVSTYDHPFGAQYEEMDAVVFFKDVLVPWERVFCYRNLEICDNVDSRTNLLEHMTYQVVCKGIAKTEFLLGLTSMMVEGSGLERFQHIHEKLSEIWVNLETVKALRSAAETGAKLNEFGVMVPDWAPLLVMRNLYPKLYPRMVEIVQQIGASGLVALPTKADMDGPMRAEIDAYYQGARMTAGERIPLYRLAWDTALSGFAGRQVLYERFFFGDPVQNASGVFNNVDRTDYMDRVEAFLDKNAQSE